MILANVITSIGDFYKMGQSINNVIGIILGIIVIHHAFYFVIGMFFTRKFKKAKKYHKYGIVIAARNESAVIANLLDSIDKQKYPKDKYRVFVVADNCTDNTAEICRNLGATVYERFDDEHRTKGYALKFLFENIKKDYGIDAFEGYFVFDADNLLKENYLEKMNDAFDEGCKIITSYRNTKNFDESWVASTYALHWIRSIRTGHRARSVLHLATNIQGTGFLFSNEIVENGWKYTSLTEDRALTADAVAQGYEITYQDEAEFYDEQPVDLKIALRQRLRWSKGHLQAFIETGPYLFINIFAGKHFIKTKWNKKEKKYDTFFQKVLESIRHRFASFDVLVLMTPLSVINIVRWLIFSVIIYMCYTYTYGIDNVSLYSGSIWLAKLLRQTNDVVLNISPSVFAMTMGFLLAVFSRLLYRIGMYFSNSLMAIYLFIIEEARITKMNIWKKLLYTLTWPTFDIIGRYTTYIALFTKVTWKPIPHKSSVTIDDIKNGVSHE